MATNPSKQGPIFNPATQRGSRINDPQFTLAQGYSPFDLSHQEMFTARFGEYTPSMHVDTIPADRFVIMQNYKAIHNQINGNFLSTVNMYDETFFVSIANLIPNAYERFIPNPVKGDDLPNSALPQIPFALFCLNFLLSSQDIIFTAPDVYDVLIHKDLMGPISSNATLSDAATRAILGYKIGYMSMLAYILSRGQLMDFLGLQLDRPNEQDANIYNSDFQFAIDKYFRYLWSFISTDAFDHAERVPFYNKFAPAPRSQFNLTSNQVVFTATTDVRYNTFQFRERPDFRGWLMDCFEAGDFPLIWFDENGILDSAFVQAYNELREMILSVFGLFFEVDPDNGLVLLTPTVENVDASADPFRFGFINALKPLAYQQIIAQYCTNDHIDNIYTSDLYMQNIRSVMFPSTNGLSQEPVYTYNGVEFEYDLMTFGAWRRSFLDLSYPGNLSRSFVFASMMFVLRRSLRYGDYFATGRPNMLAVGDLYINVEDGKVSPVTVTENLLMQRFLNSANHLGQRIDSLYAAVYGVVPSDRPVCPRYVSHRKTTIYSQITNNTADKQGKQTTNLVANADGKDTAVDIFLDDYGVLLSIVSYDVLPVYTTGIDRTFHFSDRFDYYNSQLQNIGDQPVLQSEVYGDFALADKVFAYQMRNAEYKYKVSRAHGGLVNDLPGFVFRYPPESFRNKEISPDYIRDKPKYFDQVAEQMTGTSPADYYHFVVSCQNSVKAARLMQATPPILF